LFGKKKDKKTIIVSNMWKETGKEKVCIECGGRIEYSWGEYSFKLQTGKTRKETSPLCKTCAVRLQQKGNTRLVPESFFQNQVQMKTALWRKKTPGGENTSQEE
jgi:hypothetical protein